MYSIVPRQLADVAFKSLFKIFEKSRQSGRVPGDWGSKQTKNHKTLYQFF